VRNSGAIAVVEGVGYTPLIILILFNL